MHSDVMQDKFKALNCFVIVKPRWTVHITDSICSVTVCYMILVQDASTTRRPCSRTACPSTLQFWCTSVCMGQHHLTLPMSSTAWPILRPRDGCTPPPHHRWLCVTHGCPLSAIVATPAPGTVCLNTSRPHPLCLFSEDAWRLFSSGVPFHDSLPQLLWCLCSDCCHFWTLKSFFLLTYLMPRTSWYTRNMSTTHSLNLRTRGLE